LASFPRRFASLIAVGAIALRFGVSGHTLRVSVNMGVDLETYARQLPAQTGKLGPWSDAIFALRKDGVPYQRIADFLRLNGVAVDRAELYRFMHRKKRQRLLQATSHPGGDGGAQAAQCEEHLGDTARTTVLPPPPVVSHSLPRFNWEEQRKKTKLKW